MLLPVMNLITNIISYNKHPTNIRQMETQENNVVSIDTPISATTKTWKLEDTADYEVINAYVQSKPPYRILQMYGRYYIEHIAPNVQAEYDDLEKAYYYTPMQNQYFTKNEFDTLREAEEAFLRLAANQVPIVHPVPDFDEPESIN